MVKISVSLLVIVAISQVARCIKNLCVPSEYSRGITANIACIQCVMNAITGDLVCNRCKNTPTKRDGSCGNPKSESIPISNCEEYYEYNGKCVACKQGYYLHQNKCYRSNLQSCSVGGFKNGLEICYSCLDGLVPAANLEGACVDKKDILAEINKEVGDYRCEVVTANATESDTSKKYRCVLCKENYILKKEEVGGKQVSKCEAAVSPENMVSKNECSTGCASCDSKKNCLWCNHYKNYFMVDRYKCVKSAHLLQAVLAVILLSISFLL